MRDYLSHEVRNVVVLGHSGVGKTAVMESMLYYTKASDRFGVTSEGSRKKSVAGFPFMHRLYRLSGRTAKSILLIHRDMQILSVVRKQALQ